MTIRAAQTSYLLTILSFLLITPLLFAQDVWDSDGDGFDDNSDNCTLTFNPDQHDTDGDFRGNLCDADFNNDNLIDAVDLGILRSNYFSAEPGTDINVDDVTNVVDLGLLRSMYLQTPGPTGTDPAQPPCNCYFSGDCPSGMFCNYGPGSFTTEDICAWRDVKPSGVPGAGCSIESNLTTGGWIPNICDGSCAASSDGSDIGLENSELVAQTISIWGDAMITPSAAGGGPVDEVLAGEALAMSFSVDGIPMVLGRQTADALAMAAGEPFHDYFCHWEGHPDDTDPPIVDLAGDECRIESGRLTIQALVAELQTPGSAIEIMNGIPEVCPDWQEMFSTQCQAGPDALNCAIQFIQSQAHFLRTPPMMSQVNSALVELLER